MKSVEFDVPGAASYERRDMAKRVIDIARDIYEVDINLEGVDLQQYYRPDGAKITKSLASILRKDIPKEVVAAKFGPFAKQVSELYTTGLSLKAEWADKTLIGEGVYESGKTCFRKDGENAVSKGFLVSNPRCNAIVLYQKGVKTAGGRCLVYFAGNRNIFLTNFYWRSIPQNKNYFITAVRHLLGLKKVLYRTNPNFFLPIYKNGDSIHVYDERTRPIMPTKKLTCPHCGVSVPEGKLYAEENGSHRTVGCTIECARKHSKNYKKCSGCGIYHQAGNMPMHGNLFYCSPCYKILTVTCSACGCGMMKGQEVEVNGVPYCNQCSRKTCSVCREIVAGDSTVKKFGDVFVCLDCLPDSGHMCAVCRTMSPTKIKAIKVGRSKIYICKDCATPLPGTHMASRLATG